MRNFGSVLFGATRALAVAAMLYVGAFAPPVALAQVVSALPVYTGNNPGDVSDLGNGPLELRILQGNAQIFVVRGTGTGFTSGSSTTLTLAATPTTFPCVGCVISGTGITAGTTVTVASGTSTTLVLSAAMTIASGTSLAWGIACPATVGSNPVMLAQAGVGADLPLYTYARICAAGQNAPGATILPFVIGAH